MIKKVLRKFYLVTFLFALSMSFFFATYVLFLARAGLDLFEINLINVFFMAGVLLFEMPTGSIADNLGRKFSFILSCFIFAVSFLLYFISNSFWMFALAELVGALAKTFYSGAFESWLVDSVNYYDSGFDMEKVYKRNAIFDQAGIMIGSVAGAYAGSVDLAIPWLMSSVGMAAVGIVGWMVLEEKYFTRSAVKRKGAAEATRKIWDTMDRSIRYGYRNKAVFNIMLIGGICSFALMGPNMQWQKLFNDNLGMSISDLGWVYAGTVLAMMVGYRYSFCGKSILAGEKSRLIASLSIIGAGLLIASSFTSAGIVFFGYYLHEFARGAYKPLKQNYLNSRINSAERATIISFDSMFGHFGAFAGLLLSGWLAKEYSVGISWQTTTLILLSALPFLYIFNNGRRK